MTEKRAPFLSVFSALDEAEMDFEQDPVRSELEERALALRRDGVSFPAIARKELARSLGELSRRREDPALTA